MREERGKSGDGDGDGDDDDSESDGDEGSVSEKAEKMVRKVRYLLRMMRVASRG